MGVENATPRVGLVCYTISGEAGLLLDLSPTFPSGRKEKYVGTLGNYNLTAGSGTPRWRANVTQTVAVQDAYSLSGTVNYVTGYNPSAEDQGGLRAHARHVATRLTKRGLVPTLVGTRRRLQAGTRIVVAWVDSPTERSLHLQTVRLTGEPAPSSALNPAC